MLSNKMNCRTHLIFVILLACNAIAYLIPGQSCSGGGCVRGNTNFVIDRAYNSAPCTGSSCGGGGREIIADRPFGRLTCSGGRCRMTDEIIDDRFYNGMPCSRGNCGGSTRHVLIDQEYRRPQINRAITQCSNGECGNTNNIFVDRPFRQISCNGGRCGSTNDIITDSQFNRPSCTSKTCGGTSDITVETTEDRPSTSIRTCFPCIEQCSNKCSTQECVNICLRKCSCSTQESNNYQAEDTELIDGRFASTRSDSSRTETVRFNDQSARENSCCYVTHPKTCYTENETGNKRCFIRRHRECSNLCSSSVVSIQEREQDSGRDCHYIRNYPYVYCGNYERINCGQCYTCDGAYNPRECSRRSECNTRCRQSIVY